MSGRRRAAVLERGPLSSLDAADRAPLDFLEHVRGGYVAVAIDALEQFQPFRLRRHRSALTQPSNVRTIDAQRLRDEVVKLPAARAWRNG